MLKPWYPNERKIWIIKDEMKTFFRSTPWMSTNETMLLPELYFGPNGTFTQVLSHITVVQSFGLNRRLLINRIRCLVYRFSLYENGFKQFKTLEYTIYATGCYRLPLDIPAKIPWSSSSSMIVPLVSHGKSAN